MCPFQHNHTQKIIPEWFCFHSILLFTDRLRDFNKYLISLLTGMGFRIIINFSTIVCYCYSWNDSEEACSLIHFPNLMTYFCSLLTDSGYHYPVIGLGAILLMVLCIRFHELCRVESIPYVILFKTALVEIIGFYWFPLRIFFFF